MSTATTLSPFADDVETGEETAAYDAWLRAKVQEAADDPRPGIPHEVVMAEIDARIERAIARHQKAAA